MALRAISMLLLAQAFWTSTAFEGRLVRKTGKVVEADGSIHEDSEASHGGVMQMSVSSEGVLETLETLHDGISRSSFVEQKVNVDDLLARVEKMVESEQASGDRDQIVEIKKLAEQILPEVQKDRDDEAAIVETNLKAVGQCNANSKSKQQTIKGSTEVAVGSRRDTHAKCRDEEKNREEHKNGRCGELDTFLDGLQDPAAKPQGRDPAVKWVQDESGYWCPQGKTVTGLNEACKTAEKEHAAHKSGCDKQQAEFESGFCVWRTEVLDECLSLETCYDSAVASYNEHVKITKQLVKRLKTEYKALKKILCFIDVWMNDKDTSTVDANQYAKCKDLDPTAEANEKLDIDYGTVAAKTECDQSGVKTHPGTAEFPNVEYSKFAKYAQEPIPCLGGGETETAVPTTGTTTEGPTTTTAGGPPFNPPWNDKPNELTDWAKWCAFELNEGCYACKNQDGAAKYCKSECAAAGCPGFGATTTAQATTTEAQTTTTVAPKISLEWQTGNNWYTVAGDTVTRTSPMTWHWRTIALGPLLDSGVHKAEFKVEASNGCNQKPGCSVAFGAIKATYDLGQASCSHSSVSGFNCQNGQGYELLGNKWGQSLWSTCSSDGIQVGDKIQVTLDMGAKTMEASINGKSCKTWTGLPSQMRFAISTERAGDKIKYNEISA